MLCTSDIYTLIDYAAFIESMFIMFSVAGLLWLRYREPNLERPIRVWRNAMICSKILNFVSSSRFLFGFRFYSYWSAPSWYLCQSMSVLMKSVLACLSRQRVFLPISLVSTGKISRIVLNHFHVNLFSYAINLEATQITLFFITEKFTHSVQKLVVAVKEE